MLAIDGGVAYIPCVLRTEPAMLTLSLVRGVVLALQGCEGLLKLID